MSKEIFVVYFIDYYFEDFEKDGSYREFINIELFKEENIPSLKGNFSLSSFAKYIKNEGGILVEGNNVWVPYCQIHKIEKVGIWNKRQRKLFNEYSEKMSISKEKK